MRVALLQSLFNRRPKPSSARTTAPLIHGVGPDYTLGTEDCERIYALADIHGHFDLFLEAMREIQRDNRQKGSSQTIIVVAGDIVDRGPSSRQLLSYLQHLQSTVTGLIVLRGNHEQLMLDSISGDERAQMTWLKSGGRQTLQAYGVDPGGFADLGLEERTRVLRRAVGDKTYRWLKSLPLSYRSGDYFFCHAGVRPGIELSKQDPHDLMWIRRAFHESENDHGAIIVHGHSDMTDVQLRHNRIGIDAGAHRTGKLAILGLQGAKRWVMQATSGPDRSRMTVQEISL